MARVTQSASGRARETGLRKVAKVVGHEFASLDNLDRALCHASTGNDGKSNYERLEFLGDAILGFLVADGLYEMEPEIAEGRLTEIRATLVARKPLAEVARTMELVRYLEVGRGIKETDLESDRILADLTEAVLAAVYLDGGIHAARDFVDRHILSRLDMDQVNEQGVRDPKTRLLHFTQKNQLGQPDYEVVRIKGHQHEQEFQVQVEIDGGVRAEGKGTSKRDAEKLAAARALRILIPAGHAHPTDDDFSTEDITEASPKRASAKQQPRQNAAKKSRGKNASSKPADKTNPPREPASTASTSSKPAGRRKQSGRNVVNRKKPTKRTIPVDAADVIWDEPKS